MYFHWMIVFLNIIFVLSLGLVTLWLFSHSLASGKVRTSSPKQRAELLLEISKGGPPLLKILLKKSHYLIGREPECDIPLRGEGIPLKIGEILRRNGGYVIRGFKENSVAVNHESLAGGTKSISPGDEITLYGHLIKVSGIILGQGAPRRSVQK